MAVLSPRPRRLACAPGKVLKASHCPSRLLVSCTRADGSPAVSLRCYLFCQPNTHLAARARARDRHAVHSHHPTVGLRHTTYTMRRAPCVVPGCRASLEGGSGAPCNDRAGACPCQRRLGRVRRPLHTARTRWSVARAAQDARHGRKAPGGCKAVSSTACPPCPHAHTRPLLLVAALAVSRSLCVCR